MFLGFVVIWFGLNEVRNPEAWAIYVPGFLQGMSMVNTLVLVHGVILILSGVALIFNFYRRLAAIVLALMLLDIVATLWLGSGLDEITVRDIGLLGMALALIKET